MKYKNEVMVGVVVLASLALIVFGAFWFSGAQWGQEKTELVASFSEVGNLQEGNPVLYRGVSVGQVTEIGLSEAGDGVYVTLNVSSEVELPPDPAVTLAPVSLFGDWAAQIVSQSAERELTFTRTTSPDILPGATVPDISQLTAVAARIAGDLEILSDRVALAFTEETAINIRDAVDDISEVTAQVSGFVEQQTVAYREVSRNVITATERISSATLTVERLATSVDQAIQQGDVEAILANARQASEGLRELSEQLNDAASGVPTLMARADTTLAGLGQTADNVSAFIDVLEPQVRELGPTLVEARQAMGTLQRALAAIEQGDGTLGRLIEDPTLYEETQAAVATLRRLLLDLQQDPGKYLRNIEVFEE